MNILKCHKCPSKSGNIHTDPHAWDGWIVTPKVICPSCISQIVEMRVIGTRGKRTFVFDVHKPPLPSLT